jgi:hypothetical protein
MRQLAEHILESKRAEFDRSKFEDRYETALTELLRRKQAGMPALEVKPAAAPSNVVNLMDALRRSWLLNQRSTKGRFESCAYGEGQEAHRRPARDAAADHRQGRWEGSRGRNPSAAQDGSGRLDDDNASPNKPIGSSRSLTKLPAELRRRRKRCGIHKATRDQPSGLLYGLLALVPVPSGTATFGACNGPTPLSGGLSADRPSHCQMGRPHSFSCRTVVAVRGNMKRRYDPKSLGQARGKAKCTHLRRATATWGVAWVKAAENDYPQVIQ